ncbi:hypothetical protein FACS1894111_12500 [Clostridia bacterium]|nr:hypothetical protein FACS1894111_12500 [Clostridia bacterium]
METVIPIFPPHLRVFAAACFAGVDRPEEIRLRAGQPLLLYRGGGEFFWNPKEESLTKINQEKTNQENINQERITQESINQEKINQKNIRLMQERGEVYITKKQDVTDILSAASTYSLYAFEEEIRSGFLTLFGGHRIGLAGRAVCEGGMLKTLRQISFLNIRIAAEHPIGDL